MLHTCTCAHAKNGALTKVASPPSPPGSRSDGRLAAEAEDEGRKAGLHGAHVGVAEAIFRRVQQNKED